MFPRNHIMDGVEAVAVPSLLPAYPPKELAFGEIHQWGGKREYSLPLCSVSVPPSPGWSVPCLTDFSRTSKTFHSRHAFCSSIGSLFHIRPIHINMIPLYIQSFCHVNKLSRIQQCGICRVMSPDKSGSMFPCIVIHAFTVPSDFGLRQWLNTACKKPVHNRMCTNTLTHTHTMCLCSIERYISSLCRSTWSAGILFCFISGAAASIWYC